MSVFAPFRIALAIAAACFTAVAACSNPGASLGSDCLRDDDCSEGACVALQCRLRPTDPLARSGGGVSVYAVPAADSGASASDAASPPADDAASPNEAASPDDAGASADADAPGDSGAAPDAGQ